MMENRLKQTVKTFSDIVEAIEELEIVERETVSKIKAKLRLFDGSMLWAREVCKEHRGQVFILDKRVLYYSKEEGGEPPRLNKCKRDLRG